MVRVGEQFYLNEINIYVKYLEQENAWSLSGISGIKLEELTQ